MWINVKGHWHEKKNEQIETYFISTAMVPVKTSEDLLRELISRDPYDYRLPDFDEVDVESNSGVFQLKGWINDPPFSKGLDVFDPYGSEINYPPYSVGVAIMESLGLIVDSDGKYWQKTANGLKNTLTCDSWSSYKTSREEEPDQKGMRLKAKWSFIKNLCKKFDCDLIFDNNITREINYLYDKSNKEYAKPQHKLFFIIFGWKT
ncbi:MAG: hypothetical protein IPG12_03240 [Saprospiraceae bacterium]|nr:hypothetical protein [Saprospiraceae bacterium]